MLSLSHPLSPKLRPSTGVCLSLPNSDLCPPHVHPPTAASSSLPQARSSTIACLLSLSLSPKLRPSTAVCLSLPCSDLCHAFFFSLPSIDHNLLLSFPDMISYFRDPSNGRNNGSDIKLPLFNFGEIASATNYFSDGNKLGEGGFGPVYLGMLREDEKFAVKRLAKTSQQGVEEFKNEVMLIAKLQHRNLVSLVGCCVEGDERILVYEFMPNKSLDAFLFDKTKSLLLDWRTRHQIIVGITHGLLYLHHDSRLRIIHRDLKASNILLDGDMNPKISDFGMARIFGGDEKDFNTRKVVGTYGYMSPEYAMDGIFSVKSDVFSYGVLLLEIISGRRNRGDYPFSSHINLVAHVWSLWNEGEILQLVDESISQSYPIDEVFKYIKIGLLCVQEHPEDRPLLSSVIQMLGVDIASLPQPKKPGFITRFSPFHADPSFGQGPTSNEITFSMFEGR